MSSVDLNDLYKQFDKICDHSEVGFWAAYQDYITANPGDLSPPDQITFLGKVMDNSIQPPIGKWSTPQVTMGAILTGYTGSNWDYLTGSCPYIPLTSDAPTTEQADYPAEMWPYPSPPPFWPPALFWTKAVVNDRYTAARVLRLSLAINMQTEWAAHRENKDQPVPPWNPPAISQVEPGSPGSAPFDPFYSHPVSPSGHGESAAIAAVMAIAPTLAFALPSPYGPVLAGGLGLLSFFMSSADSQTAELVEVLQSMEKDIKDYISHCFFEQDLSAINTCSTWLSGQLEDVQDMGWDEWVDTDWTNELKKFTEPGEGNVYQATNNIWNLHLTEKWEIGALDAWVAGESLILMSMKLLLQTYALAEARERRVNDEAKAFSFRAEWWKWYDRYTNEVRDWSRKAQRWIHDQIDDRLCLVTPSRDYSYYSHRWPGGNHDWSQAFRDGNAALLTGAWPSSVLPSVRHPDGSFGSFNMNPLGPDPLFIAARRLKHWTDDPIPQVYVMQQIYRDYNCGTSDGSIPVDYLSGTPVGSFAGLAEALDASFAGAIKTISQWVYQHATWTAAVPPLAPTTPPSVKLEPGTGNAWPPNADVSYAYSLGNSRGVSTPSVNDANGIPTGWTPSLTVSPDHYPTLTFDPATDAHLGGIFRYVYRTMTVNGATHLQCISAMPVAESTWADTYVHPLNLLYLRLIQAAA